MKKLAILILSLLFTMTFITMNEVKADGPYTLLVSDVEWDGAGTITGYTNITEKDIVIPSKFGDENVTTIGTDAFKGNGLTSVVIPNTVSIIGDSAFYDNLITSVVIPDSVTSIGDSSFYSNRLTSVVIGINVITIGSRSFMSNVIESILIPNGVTSIGDNAFRGNQLTSLVIPDSVINIGPYAFYVNHLESVVLSENLASLGASAFRSNQLTSIILPDSLTVLENYVFRDNLLTSITIPDTITSIGTETFYSNRITYVTIGNHVTTIGNYAFKSNSLVDIFIPNSVINMGIGVFTGNYTLGKVTVSNTANLITDDLSITGINPELTWYLDQDLSLAITVDYVTNNTGLLTYYTEAYRAPASGTLTADDVTMTNGEITNYVGTATDIIIPVTIDGVVVTSIGENTFKNTGLTNVSIPISVSNIGSYAFADNNLTLMTIPNGVNSIGSFAFSNNALVDIFIPDSVTNIGTTIFKDNATLEKVTLSNGTNITTQGGFSLCMDYMLAWYQDQAKLTVVTDEFVTSNTGKLTYYSSAYTTPPVGTLTSSDVIMVGGEITDYVGTATDIIIPVTIDGVEVTSIGVSAFNHKGLTSVIIPDSVLAIKDSAFNDNVLRSVIIPDNVLIIGNRAFFGNTLTSAIIGNGVVTIGEYSFANNDLTSLTIGTSVSTIGQYSFAYSNLTNVVLPNSITSTGKELFLNNNLNTIEVAAFSTYFQSVDSVSFSITDYKTYYQDEGHTLFITDSFTQDNTEAIIYYVGSFTTPLYTLSFDSTGGSGVTALSLEEGAIITQPVPPTKTGFTFYKWYSDEALTIPYVFGTMPAEYVTLYAKWDINSYTATFQDYDTTELSTSTVDYLSDATAPVSPTRTGYTFAGWDVAFDSMTEDIIVTATYTINSYTATFKDFDGTVLDTSTVEYLTGAFAPAEPTRFGYTFAGWDVSFDSVSENMDVIATYTAIQYTIEYLNFDGTVLQTGNYDYNSDLSAVTGPVDPIRTGFTFIGWDTSLPAIMPGTTVTLTATYGNISSGFETNIATLEPGNWDVTGSDIVFGTNTVTFTSPDGESGIKYNREITEEDLISAIDHGNMTLDFFINTNSNSLAEITTTFKISFGTTSIDVLDNVVYTTNSITALNTFSVDDLAIPSGTRFILIEVVTTSNGEALTFTATDASLLIDDAEIPTIHTNYNNAWTSGNVGITITATDSSGIKGIYDSAGNLLSTDATFIYTASTNGEYSFYSVDNAGKASNLITVVISNIERVAPVIVLTGEETITIEVDGTYTEHGATCTDNIDETCTVIVVNTVVNTLVGTYTITYNVTDAAGNEATEVTRTVIIQDTIAPVITRTGDDTIYVEYLGTYTELGALFTDNYDTAGNAVVGGDTVDSSLLGSYTITYNVTDSEGNVALEVTRTVIVQDTTAPVITLTGDATIYVEYPGLYTELGAVFTDAYDTNGNAVVGGDTVNSSVLGTYTITYNVTDSEGNVALEVTRTVIVQDTTAPVITRTGAETIYIEYPGTYTELGALFTDAYDTNDVAIIGGDTVNSSVLGTYTVTYNVTDNEGNIATEVTRTVIVQDTKAPVITRTGVDTIYVEYLSTYTELGALFTDAYDTDGNAVIGGDTVDSCLLGTYTVTYNVTDSEGNEALEVTRTVIVQDKTVPVITLTGVDTVYVEYLSTYTELGALFTDAYDTDGSAVIGGDTVNNALLGTYTITYNVTDSEGNVAETVTRTVIVQDTIAPVITRTGAETIYVEYLETYTELGALFTDAYDTNGNAVVGGDIVFNFLLGTYTVTYNITDSEGNKALEITRTVIVQDTTIPVIALSGDTTVYVEYLETYTELGALFTDAYDNNGSAVVGGDTVNNALLGTYTITYNATDTEGNVAETVTRTVIVQDTTLPEITLTGDTTVYVEIDGTYSEPGATFSDNYGIDEAVTITGTVNTAILGDYTILYNIIDIEGNTAVTVTRTVTVRDTTAPVITITGSDTISVEYPTEYNDQGATCTDNEDTECTVVVTSSVDDTILGTYTVTYNVTDSKGNVAATVTRTVIVQDTTAPVIALTGAETIYVEYLGTYTELGALFTDDYDANGSAIVGGDTINNALLGTYTITYNVTDSEGNVTETVTRTVIVQDTTAPVITLTGAETIYVEYLGTYTELGALFTDSYDANGSAVIGGDTVNNALLGTYTITYNVTDSEGNVAETVTRTVIVQDTTVPVITLTGDSTFYVEYLEAYTELGSLFTDAYDTNGSAVVGGDTVNNSLLGTYTVTYNVTDSEGNVALEVTRTVIVQDTTIPVITLAGETTVYVEYLGTYTELGALFTDAYDTNGSAVVGGDTVDSSLLGTYLITYNVTDSEGNDAVEVIRTVIVQDSTAPVITRTGAETIYVEYLGTYTELGALFTDAYDTNGNAIVGGDIVNSSLLGTYIITYNVTDSEGNIALEVTRTVVVQDTTIPVITLTGDTTVYVEYLETYTELGALFTDAYDNNGSAVVGGDTVNCSLLGTYTITYNVTDSEGNVALEVTRTVIVQDTAAPVITLTGSDTIYVEYLGTYTELGALFTDAFETNGNAVIGGDTVNSSLLGTYTVTYNITDSEGNVALEVTRTVIVQDTTKPVITLTGDTTVYIEYEGTYTENGATFSDNHDIAGEAVVGGDTVNSSLLGTYIITYNVTDSEGNVATEVTRTVVVQDTIPPTFDTIPTQTVEAGVVTKDWTILITNIQENSIDGVTSVEVIDNVDYNTKGTYSVTVKVIDNSNNETSQTFDVVIVDTTPPTYNEIDDITIEAGLSNIDWRYTIENVVDNADDGTHNYEVIDTVDYDTVGKYTVTVNVVDDALNETSKTFEVTVKDTTAPTFKSISAQTIEAGEADIDWTTFITDIKENTDGETVNTEIDLVDYGKCGLYTVTVVVTDVNGNNHPVDFTVTVTDTMAPTFDIIQDQIIEAGSANIDWTTMVINCTDNSTSKTTSVEIDTVDYGTEGIYSVTVKVRDFDENESAQVFNVTVVDKIAPTFDDIQDQTIESGTADIDWTTYIVGLHENSSHGTVNVEVSDTVDYNTRGTYNVTVKATDSSGNNTSKTFSVNVTDTVAPTFDLILDQTIEAGTADIDWTTYITNIVENNDEGTLNSEVTDTVDYNTRGTYPVSVNVIDAQGLETVQVFNVTIEDTIAPIFNKITDQTIEAGTADIDWITFIEQIVENTDEGTTSVEVTDAVDYNTRGTYNVTLKVTDAQGLESTQLFNVTVVDTIAPTFDLITTQTIEAGSASINWTSLIDNIVENTDEGTVSEVVTNTVDYDTVGTYNVTVSVTDVALNKKEVSFTVLVEDTIKPTFDLSNQTIEAGMLTSIRSLITNIVENSDSIIQYSEPNKTVVYNEVGTYNIEVRMTDASGNYTEKSVTVTVVDTIAPKFTNEPTGTVEIEFAQDLKFSDVGIGAVDVAEGDVTLRITTDLDLATLPIGEHVITYHIEDQLGNESENTVTIVIIDTTVPELQEIKPIIIKRGSEFDIKDYVTVTDNYDLDLLDHVVFAKDFTLSKVGQYNTTVQVEDSSGNVLIYDLLITVEPQYEAYIYIAVAITILSGVTIFLKTKKVF